ncbi:MAG: glycohydrolase toxin TNT-related protein [Candidatus Limivicinus sp.]|nr:glycohydrolase toxin TNT-related protein [Candidatus Limivicinus sp.]
MYSYGDSSWLDLLTAYDGQSISYDSIGNPTSWYDGTTFTWSNGRRLTSAVNSSTGLNNSYTYDMDGLRLTKTVGSVEHKYVWQGSKLVAEYFGGTELEFFYDENGAPYAFSYKATASATPVMYYYVTNLQGDVVSILNASGTSVAEYSYNAWGKVLSATGTMAAINPIRYRGYYFDSDSGLYYVASRYYNPEIGRWINADSQLNAKDGILGYNMFAYCNNNPIKYSDQNGHSIILACIIVGAIVGALAGGHIAAKVSKSKTGKVNGWAVAGGIAAGGILGGLIGWGAGTAATAICAAAGTAGAVAAPAIEKAADKATTALQTYYPPNNGFYGAVEKVTLDVGTIIQRTGDLAGRFTAPAGTPSQMLSLPYDKIGQATTYLQTTQPVQALSGMVAPWFGQIGGGTQYLLVDGRVDQLLEQGILKIFGA